MTLNLASPAPHAAKRDMTAEDLKVALGECLGLLEASDKVVPLRNFSFEEVLLWLDATRQSPVHLCDLHDKLHPSQRR